MTDERSSQRNPASATAALHGTSRPSRMRAWVIAMRPATLTAAVVPVMVGTACALAAGAFRAGPALAALLGAVLIQIGTNFANDVFDHEQGADDSARVGPTRATQSGLLSAASMRRGMAVAFGLAFAVGMYLVWVAGWILVVIGVASILSGIAYTGGPFPLGYHGLGDVFVLIFFGFVAVCGTTFVQAGYVPALAWIAAAPVGALATAILVVNNVRDRDGDARAGKRTLVVRLGWRAGILEYVFLLGVAYAVPLWLVLSGRASPWALAPLLTLPVALGLARALVTREGAELNPVLAGTARLLLMFGVLFSLGLVVG